MFGIIGLIIAIIFMSYLFKSTKEIYTKSKPFLYIVPNNSAQVSPDNTPLHIRRGWKQNKNVYTGFYRTKYGAWEGRIERRGDLFKVYIFNPPVKQLKYHSRWVCFHHKGGKKYQIDLAINPKDKDVGAIIYFVENIIITCFQRQRGVKWLEEFLI